MANTHDTAAQDAGPARGAAFQASVGGYPRLVAGLVFAGSFALLLVAASLQPDARGYGTHEHMGLPPCGFKAATDLPCMTCHMTTSFAHATNGALLTAFLTQPAGAVLAVLTAMTTVISGYALIVGMPLGPLARALWCRWTAIGLGVLLLAGWTYTLSVALGFL